MDINLFRGVLTAVLLIAFVGIAIWAFWPSRKRKARFDEASRLPLADDDNPPHDGDEGKQ